MKAISPARSSILAMLLWELEKYEPATPRDFGFCASVEPY